MADASEVIHRADRAAYNAMITARTLAHQVGVPVTAGDILDFARDEVNLKNNQANQNGARR